MGHHDHPWSCPTLPTIARVWGKIGGGDKNPLADHWPRPLAQVRDKIGGGHGHCYFEGQAINHEKLGSGIDLYCKLSYTPVQACVRVLSPGLMPELGHNIQFLKSGARSPGLTPEPQSMDSPRSPTLPRILFRGFFKFSQASF